MRKFLTYALAGVMALGLTGTVYANICATDAEPAATLLFPFVQYDYEGGDGGQTTLFAITNVSADAQIVHITVWTDYSMAILDFNLTLTGYDVQTFNIRDILRDGTLPADPGSNIWWDGRLTTDDPPGLGTNAGGAPFDDGPFSRFNELWGGALDTYFGAPGNANLPAPDSTHVLNCAPPGTPSAYNPFAPDTWISSPVNYADPIPAGTLDIFQGYLQSSQLNLTGYSDCDYTGSISFTNGTWFTNQDPRPTWMYVTADVVGACNKELPDGAANYYNEAIVGSGAGSTTPVGLLDRNVLIGDVIWLDPGNGFSEADNAVHIEAVEGLSFGNFGTTPIPTTAKNASFYGRYHLGALQTTWEDDREPLPTAWAFRYLVSEANQAQTWIRAWKGSTVLGIVDDLRGPDLDDEGDPGYGVYDPIGRLNPSELWANSCFAYTYYSWDEDENVNSVGPGFIPPWSGGPTTDPIPVPNLLPLETQEVNADQFFLVGSADEAFGWLLFVWPQSNDTAAEGLIDLYQTWMGVKYAAFGQFTAGLSGAVMANYNCDATEVLPILGLNAVD